MFSCIQVSLILTTIFHQISSCKEEICREEFHSLEVVASCPTTKKDLDNAVRKKKCHLAAQKMCGICNKTYVYHCVINEFRNETLEVCAEPKYIFGFCPEFNVGGGVIQRHALGQCNPVFPKCDKSYISSDAYKYSDCYKLPKLENQVSISFSTKYSNSSDFETTPVSSLESTTYNEKDHKKNPPSGAIFIMVATCLVACGVFVPALKLVLRKELCRRERTNDGHGEDNLDCLMENAIEADVMPPMIYVYPDATQFDHFQYNYNLAWDCKHRLMDVCTKQDLSDFASKNVVIRIGIVGDFTEENLKLLSKGKVSVKSDVMHREIWKNAPLLCFQNDLPSKSVLKSLRRMHACHKILIQSKASCVKTHKADDSIIIVGQNKQQIKQIITSCLEKQLDQILQVWLRKLKTNGFLKRTSEVISEIEAIRKQLILNTSKATSGMPCVNNKFIVPKDIKEYLFRQFDVNSFGIWGSSTFQIFVKKGTNVQVLKSELIKLDKKFFKQYQLKIETRYMIEKHTIMHYDSTLLFGETFQKSSSTKPSMRRRNWRITLYLLTAFTSLDLLDLVDMQRGEFVKKESVLGK